MQKLKQFSDGVYLAFDKGYFDDYRVSFYDKDDRYLYSPTDIQFFNFLLSVKNNQKVWETINIIAEQITASVEYLDITIFTINKTLQEEKCFSALAAAMVAEERKKHTILKKRIKLLGIYQVLFIDMPPNIAANWSKGKHWTIIDAECRKYGI